MKSTRQHVAEHLDDLLDEAHEMAGAWRRLARLSLGANVILGAAVIVSWFW